MILEVITMYNKILSEISQEYYRIIQDRLFMSDFDKYMLELEENAKK